MNNFTLPEDSAKQTSRKRKMPQNISKPLLKLQQREFIINMLKQNEPKRQLQSLYEEKFNQKISIATINRVLDYYEKTGNIELKIERIRIMENYLINPLPFDLNHITTKSEQKNCQYYRLFFEQSLRPLRPLHRIIYSDCIWFDLDGKFDDTNLWSNYDSNLKFFKKFSHKRKLGIWCAMTKRKLYKFTFFHNALTKNDYKKVIFDFMDDIPNRRQKFIFQHLQSDIHSNAEVNGLLNSSFKKVFNLEQPYCNMTLIKSIFWPYLQSLIYIDKPRDIEQLQKNIIDALENLTIADFNYIRKSYLKYLKETKDKLKSLSLHFN